MTDKIKNMFKALVELVTYWGDEQEDVFDYDYYRLTNQ